MAFAQNQIDSLDYYYKNQNFIKAIEYGQKKIKILESKNLKYTPECSITYGSLGDIYRETKDFKLAEISYLNEIEIITKVVGFDSSSLGTSYWCLANIYNDMKDYEKAVENYIIAIKIKRKVLGEKNLEYENYLIDLAIYYGWRNEDKKAVDLFKYICELRKINYGFESLEYNNTLLTFAIYYFSKNDFSNHDLIIQRILKFYLKNDLKTESVKNRKAAQFIFQIALMLERQNDIFNADLFFKKTLELQPKFLNKKDSYDSDVLFYSGLFYFKINRIKEATKLFCVYIETSKFLIKNKIIILTNLEQNDFKNDFFIKRFQITSVLNLFPTKYPEINIGCYENELLIKNLSLRNQQRIAKSIQKSGDTILQEKYKQFLSNKKKLDAINNLTIAQRPTDYDQLSTTTENLEKELTRLSSNFAEAKNSLAINWKQIQDRLQTNEIAIDLVSFQYYNKKWTDSIVYSAFVVGKKFKVPKYIPLFEQKQLEFLLYRNQSQTDNKKIDNQYTDKSISDLFLKPLKNELNGITTVYLSPSGLGHQINFSALPVSENQTLGEKFKLHILGSTTEIIDYKMASIDKKNNLELLLYGNIDYNKTDVSNLNNKDTIAENQDFVAQTRNVTNETAMHPFLGSYKYYGDYAKSFSILNRKNFTSITPL
jgi:hypothetical protein